jgi:predicted AAA+ superfamily ATPase
VDSRYRPRIVDAQVDEFVTGLAAVSLEGARAVGKTATAMRRARTIHRLDDPRTAGIIAADHARVVAGEPPVLIDEWQRIPASWDLVRRAVDDGAPAGSFLLTGSAVPPEGVVHSGAGRIAGIRMRPMTMAERLTSKPTVSLAQLLDGGRPDLSGETAIHLTGYCDEIIRSGFPGIRGLPRRLRDAQLDAYIDRIVERDFEAIGYRTKGPATLRAWLAAYAAATATTASFETIRALASSADGPPPARSTVQPYRDALLRLYVLDPVDGWLSTRHRIRRLTLPQKHHLVDPALAVRLMEVEADQLLTPGPDGGSVLYDGPLLGALFESLCTQSARVYAQAAGARIGHLRTRAGEREIDLVVHRGRRVVALEVKLAEVPADRDLRHLHWLADQLGDDLADTVVITTGRHAYRRPDGIGVVPLALLGP